MRSPSVRRTLSQAVLPALLLATAGSVSAFADCASVAGNLIQNCGFENGSDPAGSNVPAGWSVQQWNGEEQIATDHVNSGSNSLRIANDAGQGGPLFNGAAILSQSFTDHAGDQLTFDFYLYDGAPNGGSEQFQVFFDNTSGNPVYSTDGSGFGTSFQELSFNLIGTGSDSITFTSYNNPSWFWLDDVSVVDNGGGAPAPPPVTGVTPEPSSLLLMGTGLLGCAGAAYRRVRAGITA